MPTLRLVTSAALAVLLLAPLGAATSGRGDLKLTDSARLPGTSAFEAASASLQWNGDGAPRLDLSATGVSIQFYGTNKTVAHVPVLGNVDASEADAAGSATHGASKLRLIGDLPGAILALTDAGSISAHLQDSRIAADQGVLLASAQTARQTAGDCNPRWCMAILGVYELGTRSTTADVVGDITFIIRGLTLEVTDAGGVTLYKTGSHTTDSGASSTTTDMAAIVTVQHATGTFASQTPVTWFAAAPVIQADAMQADSAAGSLAVGTRHYTAANEPLDLGGKLAITGAPVPQKPQNALGKPTPASDFTLHVAGEVQSVNLRATPVFQDKPAQAIGLAAALALSAGLVAYSWQHLTYAAAALYTRLKQPTILDNEVRNGIYEIIRTNPGISARAVHRHSAQSWGTVVYHLRQLERHQLVVSRSVGRTRNYYENHGKYRGMEVQLACLQSPRARVLARLVLSQPGITQEELVAKSDFPQPTTSYYVRKLKASALVEERREGRYARYYPLGEIGRFLELADASTTPTVGLADGVQA